MKPLDLRDIKIVENIPEDTATEILTVGAGTGRIEYHLSKMGYSVLATDIERLVLWNDDDHLKFHQMSILEPDIEPMDIVICAQVVEHLPEYKEALVNLIKLAKTRLIITTPYKKSFNSPDHCNHWDDSSVKIFREIASPHKVTIEKIITKEKDKETGQLCYLIVIDKETTNAV